MSLIKIINVEHSAEFGQLITDIKANVLSYLEARQKAQKERMDIGPSTTGKRTNREEEPLTQGEQADVILRKAKKEQQEKAANSFA